MVIRKQPRTITTTWSAMTEGTDDRVATGLETNTEATGELTAGPEGMPDIGKNPRRSRVVEVAHGPSYRLMKRTLMRRDGITENAETGMLEEIEAPESRDRRITVLQATAILFHEEEDKEEEEVRRSQVLIIPYKVKLKIM